MSSDPVLTRLAERDADLHEQVCRSLVFTLPLQAARYDGLPADLLMTLATSGVGDLVGDDAATLRRWVFHHPNATEAVRVAVALHAPGADHVADDPWADGPGSPRATEELRAAAQAVLDLGSHEAAVQAAALTYVGIDPPETRRWDYLFAECLVCEYAERLFADTRDSGLWPSTKALRDLGTPEWVRTAILESGHPAALLRAGSIVSPGLQYPASAFFQLSEISLDKIFWGELARDGVVRLAYHHDEIHAPLFQSWALPESPLLPELGLRTPARWVLPTYRQDLVTTNGPYPPVPSVRARRDWLEWRGSEWEYYFRDDGEAEYFRGRGELDSWLDMCALALTVAVVGSTEGLTHGLRVTPAGVQAVAMFDIKPYVRDDDVVEQDVITDVFLVDDPAPDLTYRDTSPGQKAELVGLLQGSRANPLISMWGIASHFLCCIALHPATPEDLRARLAEDEDAAVRAAAEAGAGGAQKGAVARAERERWGLLAVE